MARQTLTAHRRAATERRGGPLLHHGSRAELWQELGVKSKNVLSCNFEPDRGLNEEEALIPTYVSVFCLFGIV